MAVCVQLSAQTCADNHTKRSQHQTQNRLHECAHMLVNINWSIVAPSVDGGSNKRLSNSAALSTDGANPWMANNI